MAISSFCLLLAVQTHNATVETIEGISDSGEMPTCSLHFGSVTHCNAASVRRNVDGGAGSAEAIAMSGSRTDSRTSLRQLLPVYRLPAIVDAVETTARTRAGRLHDISSGKIERFLPGPSNSYVGKTCRGEP